MKITILNMPRHNATNYLESLIVGLNEHSRYKNSDIKLISEYITDSSKFSFLELLPINFVPYLPSDPKVLDEYASGSDIVFVMCNTVDNDPDGYTFDIVNRLQFLKEPPKYIVAECMQDSERDRILKEGADAVIRPTRTYSSIFVRSIASFGSEEILENLIDMDTDYQTLEFNKKSVKWSDVYFEYYNQFGAAVGYYDLNHKIHLNPKFDDICDIEKLFFIKR